jgi:glycosyltransferase involved in cell wall biosynthesis
VNLLYVSDSTTVSGAEVVLLNYVDKLRPPDHRTHVFLRSSNARLIEALEKRGIGYTATNSYSRFIIQTTANPIVLAHIASSLSRVAGEMSRVIRDRRIDVIHSISYPASLYCAWPARRSGVPHVWHEHNIKRIHRFNRPVYRWVGSSSAFVIGPSDAVTNNLRTVGFSPSKARTIYNGIDLRKFSRIPDPDVVRRELGLLPGTRAIGLFGQMLPYKGHKTLIEAAPSVLKHHPKTAFFIVGARENPPYEAELEAEIARLGIGRAVHFPGWREDVQRVIQAMDAIVVATTTPEPAALALMETMAMSRPIVATRTGGTPEIVKDGETGLLFPPGDSRALGDCLVRLLDDPEMIVNLGRAGRTRVESEYSLERHIETMVRLYREAQASAH